MVTPEMNPDRLIFAGCRSIAVSGGADDGGHDGVEIDAALALGRVGGEVQRPLATVIVGGLITSTAVTLLFLLAFYKWFAVARLALEA